jgi:hypothetical protein
MNYKIAYIEKRKDLKLVLKENIGQIAITNKKLAGRILILKKTVFIKLFFAILSLIISFSNFFNLVGWISGVIALRIFGYSLLSTISYLGLVLGFSNIYKIYFKYKINKIIEPEDEIFDEKIYMLLILK